MADGALFELAGNVFKLVGSFVLPEVKLAIGVKTEIKRLGKTVSLMQSLIQVAEKQSSHSHQNEDWLRKLKVVLNDAEELLDDFSTEVDAEVCNFSCSSNPLTYGVKTAREIKAIRKRLNDIEQEAKSSQCFVEPQVMNRGREIYSFELEREVLARMDDKKEIMERLFDDHVVENISIIPIVGFGGLGKTTLAQLVYNDKNVQTKFEIKLWVCISDIFDVQRIVREILEHLTKRKHEGSIEMLQTQLREELNGKKYLIVLDDLWNEESNKWLILRNLLMGGARGSRIIVTTRLERVVRIIRATSSYALRGLPEEKAWSLFVKMAFERGQLPENKAFISLGKVIMQKCCGVPLLIRTIASLLRTKTSENEWRSFLSYELSKITQEEGNDILSMLKLSYDHLPSHLQRCFAYCRFFPKDYNIDVTTLFKLWEAAGFIKLSNPKQRVEDVGQEYFVELHRRCFFKDVQIDKYGNISYCKMHDLVHDLATHVAGMESTMLTSSEEYNGINDRHVPFDLEDSSRKFPIFDGKGMKIRTILIASIGRNLGNLTCDALVSNFNYLWTLDLSELNLCEVPHSIGGLKHLRYLDLSNNKDIQLLPNSITKLLKLRTLKLSGCRSLKELPRGLKKLVNLRNLDINNCTKLMHMPLGLGHLTSLEILPMFILRQEGLKARPSSWYKKKQARSGGELSELKQLNNLGGSLEIKYLGHGKDDMVECKATNMNEKLHLQELKLFWKRDDGESECYDEMSLEGLRPHPNLKELRLWHYMGVRIPRWVSSITNLVKFELSFNRRLQHLPPLNQLPSLKFVSLQFMEALEYIWIDEDSVSNVLGGSSPSSISPFFPSLSSLELYRCPNLKGWRSNSNGDDDDNESHSLLLPSFPPCLSELYVVECPNLTSMPLIPDLTLKKSYISGCPLLWRRGK